ncbi:MAG: hypothetical protein GX241_01955 [Ruminococcaceae bacterium]|nr:hypothetical protein [Oscillospiraceae bacterium]
MANKEEKGNNGQMDFDSYLDYMSDKKDSESPLPKKFSNEADINSFLNELEKEIAAEAEVFAGKSTIAGEKAIVENSSIEGKNEEILTEGSTTEEKEKTTEESAVEDKAKIKEEDKEEDKKDVEDTKDTKEGIEESEEVTKEDIEYEDISSNSGSAKKTNPFIKVKNWWKDRTKVQKILLSIASIIMVLILMVGGFIYSKLNLIEKDDYEGREVEEEIDVGEIDSVADAKSLNDFLKKWATNGGKKMKSNNVKNVLVIGMDKAQRLSDSMILVSIDTEKKTINLVSIYRDCYVYIEPPGKKPYFGKINSAYSRSGAKCLVQTIENNFKIEIDDYVTIDYAAFQSIIDTLGGVSVNVTSKEAAYLNANWKYHTKTGNPVHFDAGINKLNGERALMFCRVRKLDSDIGRTGRQRRVVISIISSLKGASASQLNDIVNSLFPKVKTSMSKGKIIGLTTKAATDGWLKYTIYQISVPTPECAKGTMLQSVGWVWLTDYEKAAYQLQMLLYGKSNINIDPNRVSPISLKPTTTITDGNTTTTLPQLPEPLPDEEPSTEIPPDEEPSTEEPTSEEPTTEDGGGGSGGIPEIPTLGNWEQYIIPFIKKK